ncbi:MAG: hypothetical protein ACK47B_26020 [Armatimonadota bacterium]
MALLRRAFVFCAALGGAWGGLRILEFLASQADPGSTFEIWTREGVLMSLPIGLVGAVVGAFLGALLIPQKLT